MWDLQPAIAKHIGQWATLGSVPCQVPIINSMILKVFSPSCHYIHLIFSACPIFRKRQTRYTLLFQERDNFQSQSWCKEGSPKPICQQKVKKVSSWWANRIDFLPQSRKTLLATQYFITRLFNYFPKKTYVIVCFLVVRFCGG